MRQGPIKFLFIEIQVWFIFSRNYSTCNISGTDDHPEDENDDGLTAAQEKVSEISEPFKNVWIASFADRIAKFKRLQISVILEQFPALAITNGLQIGLDLVLCYLQTYEHK